jgi:8-oxo-dGTP pyrophosphatase MutT (NUDIX family)
VSLHADATRLLDRWQPPDTEQAELRAAYLRHLATYDDALSRSCVPEHLTAAALILSHDRRRVLLTLHRRAGLWLQTGGHCESDDQTLAGAARREAREESGIDDLEVDPRPVRLARHPAFCATDGVARHLDVQFVAIASPDAAPRRSAESVDLAWFAVERLPVETDDQVRALVRDCVRRR